MGASVRSTPPRLELVLLPPSVKMVTNFVLVRVTGRGIGFVLDVEGNESEEKVVGGSASLEVAIEVGKGRTMIDVEVILMIVEENTVVRGIEDESPSVELGGREEIAVGGADEIDGSTVELPLQLDEPDGLESVIEEDIGGP